VCERGRYRRAASCCSSEACWRAESIASCASMALSSSSCFWINASRSRADTSPSLNSSASRCRRACASQLDRDGAPMRQSCDIDPTHVSRPRHKLPCSNPRLIRQGATERGRGKGVDTDRREWGKHGRERASDRQSWHFRLFLSLPLRAWLGWGQKCPDRERTCRSACWAACTASCSSSVRIRL